MSIIKILKAEEKDLNEIVDLLNETALFLINKNIRQWKYPFDDKLIEKQIRNNEVYSIKVDNELSGTFSIKTLDYYWPAGQNSYAGDIVYFYRYSLNKNKIGGKLGYKIMPEIEFYLKKEKDIKKIRLDCWAGNIKLKEYYKNCKYEYIGDYPEEDYFISLFEKIMP